MLKPSVDTLQTPANGQVFALAKQLSKSAVERAFDAAEAQRMTSLTGWSHPECGAIAQEN
jgi:acyl-CoA reductase-like NAD-dependent aldehyde dehydrogenase